MATSEMCGCGAALSESRTSRMAAGNYVRATELRVQMLYVALTSSDPEAVQLARDGKRHLDALHRVMHDPATPAVDYARILSWTKRATRVAEDRGVDAEHALWWVQQRRSAQQYLDEEEGLTADEPGWYVPEGQERWRWWDGERWADGTRQEPPPAAIGANALRSPSVETHNLAGRGERLIALLIDWAPLYAVSGPLYWITDSILAENPSSEVAGQLDTLATLLGLAAWALFWVFSAVRSGRTWGKAVVGARTVRHDTGEPLSGGLIIWRQLLRLFGTVAWLDAVFIIRDDRRTLHDLLASSVVVIAPKNPNPIRFFSDEVLGVKREVS